MATFIDTHFQKTGAWNMAPVSTCRAQVADLRPLGSKVALAARCVR